MNQNSIPKKHIAAIIVALFVILLIIDRYYWAQISQWREDEAANLWLGYTEKIGNIPVGLISSALIPNPNGMIILGFFLSILPSLLLISFFLGFSQIALLSLIGWKFFRKNWHELLLVTIPSLTSVILRSSSVEFWNQYTITLVNIFFLFWALRYLEKSSLWNLPPIAVLILTAPALYLAGVVNAVVMAIITLGMILYKRPSTNNFWLVTSFIVLIILASGLLTWLPYFQYVSLNQIRGYNQNIPAQFVSPKPTLASFLKIPLYVPFQWAKSEIFPFAFKHADEHILSHWAEILLRWVGTSYLLQTVFAFAVFLFTVFLAWKKRISGNDSNLTINPPAIQLVVLSALIIGLSYAITLFLGGPNWIDAKRADQTVQFLPMFLFLVFLLPITFMNKGRLQKIIAGLSFASLILFAVVNLTCGLLIIRDHLRYHGRRLTEADVPLIDKQRVVDFIANDWKMHSSSNIIPVDYDLGGGRWDWVPEFGKRLEKWYAAPMTMGRSFDYELLRRYGLTNAQEGTQIRTFGDGRYLVTYSFQAPPKVKNGSVKHHIFGRLRVSIIDK
jgi:hypothetical protein